MKNLPNEIKYTILSYLSPRPPDFEETDFEHLEKFWDKLLSQDSILRDKWQNTQSIVNPNEAAHQPVV